MVESNFRSNQPVLILYSCAAINGVPHEVVQRAEDLILLSMRGEDLVAACCQMPEDEATELEEAVSSNKTITVARSDFMPGTNRQRLLGSGRL
jgi:hypothetical protein